jgi:hypothetical protein
MYTLGDLLHSRSDNSGISKAQLIPSAMVIDSCPGDGSFFGAIYIFTVSIPNVFGQFLMSIFITPLYVSTAIAHRVLDFSHYLNSLR